ncbi:MAG TPA: hypothetical protein VFW33_02710 [Gemmataceae bacterium]|nr:hypothetical protein [Gemmataceae bacterium]
MTTQTAATSLPGEVILVRLLTGKSLKPKKLRADVGALFPKTMSDERWQAELGELVAAGLLTAKNPRLTEAGRARALAFLGVDALPPRATWKSVKGRYLFPKAAGAPAGAKPLNEKQLAPILLKMHYNLTVSGSATIPRVLEALTCKRICEALGLPPQQDFRGVQAAILGRELDEKGSHDRETTALLLARGVANAGKRGVESLRDAILARWADGKQDAPTVPPPEPRAAEFDPPAFARTVLRVAADCPTGRFGDNKVFINHVWQRLRQEPGLPALDLPAFKARLVEASRSGLLRLSRADLVQVMDPGDVKESETTSGDALFHFILIERDRP